MLSLESRCLPVLRGGTIIVFVFSQYDGGNIDKEQLAEVPYKT